MRTRNWLVWQSEQAENVSIKRTDFIAAQSPDSTVCPSYILFAPFHHPS